MSLIHTGRVVLVKTEHRQYARVRPPALRGWSVYPYEDIFTVKSLILAQDER